MKPIRILLADDHDLVRAGLRSLLEKVDDFVVVAEARDGREAVRQARESSPDVILMDVMMPGLNGLDATAQIAGALRQIRVVILTMNSDETSVLSALRAGATGYLLKNVTPAEMELAIRAAARGEMYLSSGVSRHVITRSLKRVSEETSSLEKLTPRQREVLQLLAEGCSAKEVAQMLSISVRTAETHRSQIMDALDIHETAGLVRYAIRMGLIRP